jgi:hypothetical protein
MGRGIEYDKYDNNRAAYCTFTDFFLPKLEFPRGFLYIIFAERDSEAAMVGGRGKIMVLD